MCWVAFCCVSASFTRGKQNPSYGPLFIVQSFPARSGEAPAPIPTSEEELLSVLEDALLVAEELQQVRNKL